MLNRSPGLHIGTRPDGTRMSEERKDAAYYLGKAEQYRAKADAATDPAMKAAFESIVREYMRKAARQSDPAPDPNRRK